MSSDEIATSEPILRLILVGRSPVKIFAKKIGMTGANGQIVQFVAGMLHNNATELATDLGMSQKSIMVPGLGGKTNPGPFDLVTIPYS